MGRARGGALMGYLDYFMPGLPRTVADAPDMALVERNRERGRYGD